MAELDQLNVATHRYIRDNPALVDAVFQRDPLLAYLKLNVREEWEGGTLIQEGFLNKMGNRPGNGGNQKPLLIDLDAEMPTRANQIEIDLSWAACLIDAEGCISIVSCTNKRKPHQHSCYSATITSSMVQPDMLVRLQSILGGSLYRVSDKYGKVYQWRVYGRNAMLAALALRPHLMLKARHAEIIIEFQQTKGKPWEKVSDEVRARRDVLYAEISSLNQRRSRLDAERLSEAAPPTEGDAIVRPHGKRNHEKPAEMTGSIQ